MSLKKPIQKLKPLVIIMAAALLGSGTSTLSKIVSTSIPSISVNFLRFFLGVLILLSFFPILKEKINFKDWKKISLISIIATLNPLLFIIGVKYTTAQTGQMIYLALPLVTMVFSYIIDREKITTRKIAGIVTGLIGALIIILQPGVTQTVKSLSGNLTGNIIIFIGLCSYAIYTILIKKFQRDHSPLELNTYFVFTGMVCMIILSPIELIEGITWWRNITPMMTFAMLYIGIIGTGIYYLLMQYAIKNSSALAASTSLYAQSIFSFFWASALLGEHLTFDLIVGGVLAFFGMGLIVLEKQN